MTYEDGFVQGIHLFNTQKYFEAHEALEALWLKASGDRKIFLHGLIQIAAAFHHHKRNNPAGFHSLLQKGCAKLETFGGAFPGVDLGGLMLQLQPWREHARQSSGAEPSLPQIQLLSSFYDG